MALISAPGAFAPHLTGRTPKAPPLPPTSDKPAPAKAAPKAKPARTVKPPAVPSNTLAAAHQAALLLNPQYQLVNQNLQQNQGALQGFTQSVLNTLKGLPQATADDYTQAQNVTNALAANAANVLSGANPNAQDQAILQAINAPVSQQQQIAQQLGNTFTGGAGVLYDTAGANDTSALAAQKAAALGYANALPGIEGIAAVNAERNLLAKAASDRATIAAQEPTLANQILSQMNTQAYQNAELGLRRQTLANTKANQAATRKNQAANRTEKQREYNITAADREAVNKFNEWYKNAGLQERQQGLQVQIDRLNASIAHNHATESIAAANEGLAAGRLNYTVQPKFSASNSRATGVPTDQYGNPVGSAVGPATAPPGVAGGGFLPKGAKYVEQRSDQGRDLLTTPGGAIVAPGSGYVVRNASDPGGFGTNYPIVHFTSGPYAGQDIYIGHTMSALQAGQKFKAGTVLSRTGATGAEPWNGNASQPGWAEIGFAPGGTPGPFGQTTPFGAGSNQPSQQPTLPGFARDANGNVVKVSTGSKTQSVSSVATAARDLTKQVAAWGKGVPAKQHFVSVTNKDGSKVSKPVAVPGTSTAPTSYSQALQQAIQSGPNTPEWQRKATAIVNASPYYQPGMNGRAYQGRQATQVAGQFAQTAAVHATPYSEALTRGRSTGVIPDWALIPALNKAYGIGTPGNPKTAPAR